MTRNKLNITFSILILIFTISSCGISRKADTEQPIPAKTEKSAFPEPIGYVNDFENILTDEEEMELTKLIIAHENKTTDQIAVVTLTSIEPYDNLDDYSFDLANYWGVGRKDENNGILIALGRNLGEIRIQNGYGIEKQLTNNETKKIIDEIMIPEFKQDNYYQGLKKGIEAIIVELK